VRGIDPSTHDEKVRRASAMVELDDFLHRKPAELSGGQRQRVALARAIVREPNVFLMDEPLSNLDAKLRVSTRAQIKHLSHELGVTTIYVTHDQIEAMTLADRVVVMKGGVVQQVGSPTDIYDHPANTFVASFIGNPAMNLMEGTMEGGVFRSQYTEIPGHDAPDGPATLGFRAEDASVVPSGGQINAPIYTLELLGDATMVTVRVKGALVSVRADKNFRAEIHDMVSISVPSEICHLFDGKSGERIRA
jgi:multiple sugar transport system ATP-binding protein